MVGKKLKEIRERKGITQTDLAKACKISSSLISRIESGSIKNPGWDTVRNIAKQLGIDVKELL